MRLGLTQVRGSIVRIGAVGDSDPARRPVPFGSLASQGLTVLVMTTPLSMRVIRPVAMLVTIARPDRPESRGEGGRSGIPREDPPAPSFKAGGSTATPPRSRGRHASPSTMRPGGSDRAD